MPIISGIPEKKKDFQNVEKLGWHLFDIKCKEFSREPVFKIDIKNPVFHVGWDIDYKHQREIHNFRFESRISTRRGNGEIEQIYGQFSWKSSDKSLFLIKLGPLSTEKYR